MTNKYVRSICPGSGSRMQCAFGITVLNFFLESKHLGPLKKCFFVVFIHGFLYWLLLPFEVYHKDTMRNYLAEQ